MAKILVLTKTGKTLETQVLESVNDIYVMLTACPNNVYQKIHYIQLTKKDGHPVIFQKRFIYLVEE